MRLHEIEDKNKAKISRVFERWFSYSGNYNIDDEGYVNCDGAVSLNTPLDGGKLSVRFGKVDRSFSCMNGNLNSLEGIPKQLGGSLRLKENRLTSLEGLPSNIGGGIDVSRNLLTNLIGCPRIINGDLDISKNPLTSLEGLPIEINGEISVSIVDENFPILRLLLVNNVELYQIYPNSQQYMILENILNKYKDQGRKSLLQCAAELTRAGFKGNAKL